ncbi:hypothetical protein [Enterococcus mundtii]|uniref:hypothetical protein n=1 Tax=Enterococcus mundtii TaxID=53346 RepID=UPI001A95B76A|nr:hypothetical protein [Enterococcus mundtii]MBO1087160.1 hypothetical protein [Enterococcus mundtii]
MIGSKITYKNGELQLRYSSHKRLITIKNIKFEYYAVGGSMGYPDVKEIGVYAITNTNVRFFVDMKKNVVFKFFDS